MAQQGQPRGALDQQIRCELGMGGLGGRWVMGEWVRVGLGVLGRVGSGGLSVDLGEMGRVLERSCSESYVSQSTTQ